MYIDLGPDTVILSGDVIGIFDIDNTTVSKNTRGFLYSAQKSGTVVDVSGELPKSFLATGARKRTATGRAAGNREMDENRQKNMVYISQLSVDTIKKRIGSIETTKRDENGDGHRAE